MAKTKIAHRDSKDGQFVTEDYADKHPSTTERERIRIVPPGKGKN